MTTDDPAARVGENIRAMLAELASDEERARAWGSVLLCPNCGRLHDDADEFVECCCDR